jgi:hypothetical protein
LYNKFIKVRDVFCPPLKVHFEVLAVDDTCLLLEALVEFLELLSVLFEFTLLSLLVVQLLIQLLELDGLYPILLLDILELLTSVRQDDHGLSDLLSKLVELFISLFDLLVKGLILNLQLLEIDQVKTIGELLLLFEDLLFVSQFVSQGNVLQSILMHFLVLERLLLLPLIELFLGDLLSCSRENSILGDTSFEFLELLFDLVAFGLFLIKFCLELRGHLVISILGFFQVYSNLMDVGKCVQVLVLVHLNVWLLFLLVEVRIHHNDLLLEVLIFFSELILFSQLLFNGLY